MPDKPKAPEQMPTEADSKRLASEITLDLRPCPQRDQLERQVVAGLESMRGIAARVASRQDRERLANKIDEMILDAPWGDEGAAVDALDRLKSWVKEGGLDG